MFMPIYLDEDHNFRINKKYFEQQYKTTTLDDLRLSTIGIQDMEDSIKDSQLYVNDNLPSELYPF